MQLTLFYVNYRIILNINVNINHQNNNKFSFPKLFCVCNVLFEPVAMPQMKREGGNFD